MNAADETFDFIIVGSGGGSICAALVIGAMGMKPLLLEKTGLLGGTTAKSGGISRLATPLPNPVIGIQKGRLISSAQTDIEICFNHPVREPLPRQPTPRPRLSRLPAQPSESDRSCHPRIIKRPPQCHFLGMHSSVSCFANGTRWNMGERDAGAQPMTNLLRFCLTNSSSVVSGTPQRRTAARSTL